MILLAMPVSGMSKQNKFDNEAYIGEQLEKWEIENFVPGPTDYVQFLEQENEDLKKEIDELKGKNKRKRFSNENEK
jgi:hypothetical protein